MSDRLRDLGFALLGLALLNGAAKLHSEQALQRSLRDQLRGGHVRARVESSGVYGLLVGRAALARISGTGCSLDDLPFRLQPGDGMRAEVRSVQVDLRDITFRGLPVRRITVEVPNVSLDVQRVVFNDRLVLRRAGTGRAEFSVTPQAMADFAHRRYPALQDIEVGLIDGRVRLAASLSLLGKVRRISAEGPLRLDGATRVLLDNPDIRLDGRAVEPGLRSALLTSLGPLLDVERDLGLGEALSVDRVEVRRDEVVLAGRATIPQASASLDHARPPGGRVSVPADRAVRE